MIEILEEFRPIKGTDGRYVVSDKGNVLSVFARRNVNGHKTENFLLRRMEPIDNGNGYLYITTTINNKKKNIYIHRAVAEAFLEQEEGKTVVNHKDYNKKNNDVSNLEWCTQKENLDHSACHRARQHNVSTRTGYRYITKKNDKYRVSFRRNGIDKRFETLEEALQFRNRIANEIGYTV
jgi:hypothetical protein